MPSLPASQLASFVFHFSCLPRPKVGHDRTSTSTFHSPYSHWSDRWKISSHRLITKLAKVWNWKKSPRCSRIRLSSSVSSCIMRDVSSARRVAFHNVSAFGRLSLIGAICAQQGPLAGIFEGWCEIRGSNSISSPAPQSSNPVSFVRQSGFDCIAPSVVAPFNGSEGGVKGFFRASGVVLAENYWLKCIRFHYQGTQRMCVRRRKVRSFRRGRFPEYVPFKLAVTFDQIWN